MSFLVIAEEELVTGFKFAGIPGKAVFSREDASNTFREAVARDDLDILILSESVSAMIEEEVVEWQAQGKLPLIVETPALSGPIPGKKSLVEAIREAIGIKI